MGMTTNDIIQSLIAMKSVIGVNQLIINEAVDTMRKYQKIEEIYLKWNRNYDIQTSSAWTEVIEVVENGNDSN